MHGVRLGLQAWSDSRYSGWSVRTALDAFPTFPQRHDALLMTYFGQCAPVAAKDTSPSALAISDRGYSWKLTLFYFYRRTLSTGKYVPITDLVGLKENSPARVATCSFARSSCLESRSECLWLRWNTINFDHVAKQCVITACQNCVHKELY